jgi:hypothetical protein
VHQGLLVLHLQLRRLQAQRCGAQAAGGDGLTGISAQAPHMRADASDTAGDAGTGGRAIYSLRDRSSLKRMRCSNGGGDPTGSSDSE